MMVTVMVAARGHDGSEYLQRNDAVNQTARGSACQEHFADVDPRLEIFMGIGRAFERKCGGDDRSEASGLEVVEERPHGIAQLLALVPEMGQVQSEDAAVPVHQ